MPSEFWEGSTLFIDRVGLDERRRSLLGRVRCEVELPAPKLTVLLDDANHRDFSNPKYHVRAFYMDIGSGGPEGVSPSYVLEAMTRAHTDHFIWLSGEVSQADPAAFLWIYAHELRHLQQRLNDPTCAQANSLLRAAYGRIPSQPKLQIDFPAELDAELFAKRTVAELLGQESVDRHIATACETAAGATYFRRLGELEATAPSLRQHTQGLVRELLPELLDLQTSFSDPELQLDIRSFCNDESSR